MNKERKVLANPKADGGDELEWRPGGASALVLDHEYFSE